VTPAALAAVRRGGFGAIPGETGATFRVFAPAGRRVQLHLLCGAGKGVHEPRIAQDGICEFFVARAAAGDLYSYSLDGSTPRPDPASRFQPQGVHGPSEIIDAAGYAWRRPSWRSHTAQELVIYELHVGTFTSQGTFAAARERLGALRDLGVTAIELMPVADFAGTRNWGYDGVCLYAPSRNYGHPEDLRAFVDAAHELDLSVILDVVYNHLGPEGAYLPQFNPQYLTERHNTPWGSGTNLDGDGSDLVRSFILDNALHWVREYRLDGLRLDATHALADRSPIHIVAEIVDAVRAATPWPLAIHAEDSRNLATLVEPIGLGGWGIDAVWADDFHHITRRHLAGDAHSYYEDFAGTTDEIARTIQQGWLFTGQYSVHAGRARGSDPSHVPLHRSIVCLQNHDQIGNRATGDRLHHRIDPAAWRAATTILLTAPMTPLIFMGQEWAASSPFQYFTDLERDLGALVTAGRRYEFRYFPGFADPEAREAIPDPQAMPTFAASVLDWEERERDEHRRSLALYKALLHLRRTLPALAGDERPRGDAVAIDPGALLVRRERSGERFVVVARLSGFDPVRCGAIAADGEHAEVVLSTEDERFAPDPTPPDIELESDGVVVRFKRPGAVILRVR
jgi:maltooligosyltrehalose trehalohydrolase